MKKLLCCILAVSLTLGLAASAMAADLVIYSARNERLNKSFITRKPGPKAKLARLRYRHVADTDRYHLLEVELLTGRHHQIRCQLSHMGCCIKGDLKYGAPRSNPDGGICLQAHSISFLHPVKKEQLHLVAAIPQSWKLPAGVSEV